MGPKLGSIGGSLEGVSHRDRSGRPIKAAYDLVGRLDLLTSVAVLVLVVGAGQLLFGALDAGITIDEPIEAESTQSWIDTGWYDPPYALLDGEPNPSDPLSNPYVHGPAFGAVAHAANVVAGNEAIDEISFSAGANTIRHLVSALLAALAVAAVGIAVWSLTRSRRFGLWAAAGLIAVPEWIGQGFFNSKDTPAACGYTLVTVALLLALGEELEGRTEKRRRLAIGGMLAGGIFIGAGTRPALLLPLFASVLVYGGVRLGQRRLAGIASGVDTDLAIAAGTAIGYAAIAVVYPEAARTPVTFLIESISGSASWSWHGVTLTAGQLLSQNPPWWYLPAWVGASYPLMLGGLAVLGAVLAVAPIAKACGQGWRGPVWTRSDLGVLLVLQQALLLPAGALITGAVMYSGMRQHIYLLPAIAILAGIGAAQVWRWAASAKPAGRWRSLAVVGLAAALLIPMIEQTLLFPYNYTYVNPVASVGGVNGRWETDYWFASAPEAVSRVPAGAELRCFLVVPTVPCEKRALEPFEDRQGTAVSDRWRGDTGHTWVIARLHAGNLPPEYCEQGDSVTRWLRGEQVIMSYVLRCDRERLAAAGSL
jgi:hypothetical protein